MSEPTPKGWALTRLRDVIHLRTGPFGSALHQSDYIAGGTPLVNPMHIVGGRVTPSADMTVSTQMAAKLSEYRLQPGDVVLGRRGEMGRCAVISEREQGWLCGTGSLIVRPLQRALQPDYLQLLLTSRRVVDYLLAASVGSTMANLNQQHLLDMEVLLPPAAEQTRIVSKLEELLSDLDAGVAELKAAQSKLQQYRQSLLKAAVEGSLTAAWREAHPAPEETGANLLARILLERRARWEAQQLAKFEAQGKAPPKGWQGKYQEPTGPTVEQLADLPLGWTWCALGQVLGSLTSGSRDWSPYYDRGDSIFVMAQNVRPWRPDFTFKQHVDPPQGHRDRARSEIRQDDLLVTIVGANTGQSCRVDSELQSHFVCQSVALLRPVESATAEYLNAVLNSEGHGQRQFREMNYGAGRPHLSFDQLESVLIPLPPLAEQAEILAQIGSALSSIDQVETEVRLLFKQSVAQRQNLLRAAFAGQLVPQDPADEPAAELLARIRAERAAKPPGGQRGSTSKHQGDPS